jgi:hypothetical protein
LFVETFTRQGPEPVRSKLKPQIKTEIYPILASPRRISSTTFLKQPMMPEAAPWGRVKLMDWARILAFVTGMVDQELLARNEYLIAENRIMKAERAAEAL